MTDGTGRAGMDRITHVLFYKHMHGLVSDLSFGSDTFGRDASDWIQDVGYPSVRNEINKGTQVWIYRNTAEDLVGFGSLGVTRWNFQGSRQAIQYIPMLAVTENQQGRPVETSGSPKYCRQILSHILDEAEKRLATSGFVGLSVLPSNAKAISLYEQAGFEWLTEDREAGRMLLRIG